MTMKNYLDLETGKRFRVLRERVNMPREMVTIKARQCGLNWDRQVVGMIEHGRRRFTLEEFMLLPSLLKRMGISNELICEYFGVDAILKIIKQHISHELPQLPQQTDIRVSQILKIDTSQLDNVAQLLWGRSFTEERHFRLSAVILENGESNPTLRRNQALMAHVTRGMLKQLKEAIGRSESLGK